MNLLKGYNFTPEETKGEEKKGAKVVILQPGYIPWLGFFGLIDKSDIFVLLDDVQFTIRDWRTRNRIRTDKGWAWLSVPTSLDKPYFEYLIKDVKISYDHNWINTHLNRVKDYYKTSICFDDIYPLLEKHLLRHYKFLVELDNNLIFEICRYFSLPLSKFRLASEMNIPKEVKKDKRLLYILEDLGVKIEYYISGVKAKNYIDESAFEHKRIKVLWYEYKHPYYRQNLWKNDFFISHLSILDILFCQGRESLDIIKGHKVIPVPDGVTVISADEFKDVIISNEGK